MHWWVKKMCSGPSKPKHSKAASHITIVAHTCIRPAVRPQCSMTTILAWPIQSRAIWMHTIEYQWEHQGTREARHTRDQWPFWKVTLTGQQTSVATSVAADQCGQCERGGLSHLPISNIVPPHFFSQHVLWHFCSKMWSASIFHCCCDLSVTSS